MSEQDRIEALERHISEMQKEIATLKVRLMAVESWPVYPWPVGPYPYTPYEPYVLRKDTGTAAKPY